MSLSRSSLSAFALSAAMAFTTAYAQDTQTQRPDSNRTRGQQDDGVQGRQSGNTQEGRNQARLTPGNRGQEGVTVRQAILKKLQNANEAEIELARLAEQLSENPDLLALTKTIIQDHESLSVTLKQASEQDAGNQQGRLGQRARVGQQGRQNRAPQDQSNRRNLTDRDDAADSIRDDADRNDQDLLVDDDDRADANRPTDNRAADRDRRNASDGQAQNGQNQRARANRMANQQATVPQELCQIMDQACENNLQMTKEMLKKYSGQDFQMAFLGQQIVAHTMMLAELKAIESSGPEDLRSLAQKAAGKTEQHLQAAKELAQQLEDKENPRSNR